MNTLKKEALLRVLAQLLRASDVTCCDKCFNGIHSDCLHNGHPCDCAALHRKK